MNDTITKLTNFFDFSFPTGSRVYGIATDFSDWDYVCFKNNYKYDNRFIEFLIYAAEHFKVADEVQRKLLSFYKEGNIINGEIDIQNIDFVSEYGVFNIRLQYNLYPDSNVITITVGYDEVHLIIPDTFVKFVSWKLVTDFTKNNITSILSACKNNTYFSYKRLFNSWRNSLNTMLKTDVKLVVPGSKISVEDALNINIKLAQPILDEIVYTHLEKV